MATCAEYFSVPWRRAVVTLAGSKRRGGGRAGGYEKALRGAKDAALGDLTEEARALGANAVIGIDLDYETVGESMLTVSANGTAVRVE